MSPTKNRLRTASAGAEVESPVVLAARAVAVEHAARGRRSLEEEVEEKKSLLISIL